ncbi:MAG: MBL fold metallo-hydrolase [Candidatus Cloacimonetes bacterium]|jgi:ribonuclease BN (tRNA processing enzyme)|nr:MBL fold metallo-hydrolase [Candidatus Cloacimonadota bacterium]
MKFKILGKGSGLPELNKKHSCVYIQDNELNYLLDCGEGISQSFLENDINQDLIDFIVITHFHPDHISGIYMLIQLFYLKKRIKPLDIYLPENIDTFRKSLEMFYLFSDRMTYKINLLDINKLTKDYKDISIKSNDHLIGYQDFIEKNHLNNMMLSYSIKIKSNNKYLVYTSDISTLNYIKEFITNTNICIVDAMHPSIQEIKELNTIIKEKVILTHCNENLFTDFINMEKKFEIANEKKLYNFS